jgi:23S rRNA (cytidine1920-2'-O)/16S rRNA (cytidine1409-2'-O)-methyltransferase
MPDANMPDEDGTGDDAVDADERAGGTERLDQALVARGLAASRTVASRLVKSGEVEVDGRVELRPALRVGATARLHVRAPPRYVSRGGEKLAAALARFALDPAGMHALDAGASTGGFTDCLLQHGAASVHALDVGRAQLAAALRADPRVVSREGVDVRAWQAPRRFALVVADLSFISLRLVLPALERHGDEGARWVLLVKPQFEVGRERLPKDGLVKDPRDHEAALAAVLGAADAAGLLCLGLAPSPILGGEGNREFLACFERCADAERRAAALARLDLSAIARSGPS